MTSEYLIASSKDARSGPSLTCSRAQLVPSWSVDFETCLPNPRRFPFFTTLNKRTTINTNTQPQRTTRPYPVSHLHSHSSFRCRQASLLEGIPTTRVLLFDFRLLSHTTRHCQPRPDLSLRLQHHSLWKLRCFIFLHHLRSSVIWFGLRSLHL